MQLKNITLFFLFFHLIVAFAQTTEDSISAIQMQKELKNLKALRQKDSIKIALLLDDIQSFIHSNNSKKETKTDSTLIKKKREIESLRKQMNGLPIVFRKDTVYFIYAPYAPYGIDTRKRYVEEKMMALYENPFFNPDSIKVKNLDEYVSITYQGDVISGVSMVDALWANTSPENLANEQAKKIKDVIVKYKTQNSLKNILLRIVEFLLIIAVTLGILLAINRFFRFLKNWSISPKRRFLKGIKIRNYELVRKEHISNLLVKLFF